MLCFRLSNPCTCDVQELPATNGCSGGLKKLMQTCRALPASYTILSCFDMSFHGSNHSDIVPAALVGRLGAAELGAVGLSSLIFNLSNFLFNFLLIVTTPKIAAAVARSDTEAVGVPQHILHAALECECCHRTQKGHCSHASISVYAQQCPGLIWSDPKSSCGALSMSLVPADLSGFVN